ncbi:hypothetical protein HNY73_011912 [Argiope bruennichi]|uniref:Uncharacterized protein n=1 Tax=Argiope bruennichi TaxID=94029 RepID=A0A8T0EUV2_ARGBR|nr:hypothetical protein HNY73_011912 [Argiope bruennichi]
MTFAFESAALLSPWAYDGIIKSSKIMPRSVLSRAPSQDKSTGRLRAKTTCDNDQYAKLLNGFPNLTKSLCMDQTVQHNVRHHIKIFGTPVFAKARHLAHDRLPIAKMEFQHMLNLDHIRQSSSNYSSPLHMVPKKGTLD